MPIAPPKPYSKFICQSCGWNIVIKQSSDVIFGPTSCKNCGGENLLMTRISSLKGILENLWLKSRYAPSE